MKQTTSWLYAIVITFTLCIDLTTAHIWCDDNAVVKPEQLRVNSNGLCNNINYAALGDSYSAGNNANQHLANCTAGNKGFYAPYCSPEACQRTELAYSWLFNAAAQPSSYGFFACSGAATTDVLQTQVPFVPPNTTLITITVGGDNNAAFANVVKRCVYFHSTAGCASALAVAHSTITTIGPVLDQLFASLHAQAPGASLAVLGYVQFYPAQPTTCPWLLSSTSAAEKATMNALVAAANTQLSAAAARAVQGKFISVTDRFEGHRLCEADPWFQWNPFADPAFEEGGGFDDPDFTIYEMGLFHPTAVGQEQYFAALEQATGCD